MSMMNVGDIARRMGVAITAQHLANLGFEPDGKEHRAVLFEESKYPKICQAFGEWIKEQAGNAPVAKPPKTEKADKPGKKPADAPPPAAGKPVVPFDEDDDEL